MPVKGMLAIYYWWSGADEKDLEIAMLSANCPACGFEHAFRVDLDGTGKWDRQNKEQKPWEFNGDYEKPTFSPSMLSNKHGYLEDQPRCHSFLTDGNWRFLSDSTHEMAGMENVDMIPIDKSKTWYQRKGVHK